MELRHIRYFLAVAAEGNFTRAADKLRIAQPPLSQQIRALEDEVGTALFTRSARGAKLTEAGRAFLEHVSEMPRMAAEAAELARAAANGLTGHLRLGVTGTAALNPLIPRIIREFRDERPSVRVTLTEANSVRLHDDLADGKLDVAILRVGLADPDRFVIQPIASEHLIAAVPTGSHPTDGQTALHLADLAQQPLILTPRSLGTSLHDAALASFRSMKLEPTLGQQAPQIATILALVSAGLGYSLVPASMRRLPLEGVVYHELAEPTPQIPIAVVTRRIGIPAAAAAFAKKAVAMAE